MKITEELQTEIDDVKFRFDETISEEMNLIKEDFNERISDLKEEMRDEIKELKKSWRK